MGCHTFRATGITDYLIEWRADRSCTTHGRALEPRLWHEFARHTDYLRIAIRGEDQAGCVGQLAVLHSTLAEVAHSAAEQ
jgi:hypothetical protein